MIIVLLADGFEEIEALTPVDMLRRAGVEVKTVGVTGDVIDGRHGIKVIPDVLIGDIILQSPYINSTIVGFENHSGRTNIGSCTPLGSVTCGYGNNGSKDYEGVVYKNVIATYIHGPLLPKNPILADKILLNAISF